MQIDIVPSGPVNVEMMADLGELCEQLQAAGLDARGSDASLPGVKDGCLTIAIALSGLAVSSISSLVSVLSYWSSKKPRYSITAELGRSTLTLSQLDAAGVQTALKQLRGVEPSNSLVLRVVQP
jgi:hypothetical protein